MLEIMGLPLVLLVMVSGMGIMLMLSMNWHVTTPEVFINFGRFLSS
jgi:hypothetical protein